MHRQQISSGATARRRPPANRPLLIEWRRTRQVLRRLQATSHAREDRQAIRASDMPDEDWAMLAASRVPAEADRFDHEFD